MVRDLMGGDIDAVLIEFDPVGSLATTHESQGSDMGLFAGFLGWEAAADWPGYQGRYLQPVEAPEVSAPPPRCC